MKKLLILLLPLCLAMTSHARIWTTAKGKMVEADMVKANATHVLLRAGKKISKVPIALFSEKDQAYIRSKLGAKAAKAADAKASHKELAVVAQEAMNEILGNRAQLASAKQAKIESDRTAFQQNMAERKACKKAKG